jgi:hypothetical protein
MTDRAAFARLTDTEALRALYIDFEGEKDRPPVLLGVHRRGHGDRPHVQAHIVDRAFGIFGTAPITLGDAVLNVVQRAEHGDRRIVAWTEHELDVIHRDLDDALLVARFEARFANARRVAERWRNRDHGGKKPHDGRLASYVALIDYSVPVEAGSGDVGQTIRDIRGRIDRGLPPTPGQVERWRRLVEHNRHDCIAMRRVCLAAAAGTAPPEVRSPGSTRNRSLAPRTGQPMRRLETSPSA